MAEWAQRARTAAAPWLRAIAWGICFGIAGLIWSLPVLRRRRLQRAASCQVCCRHQRVRNIVVVVVAALFVAGAGARAWEVTDEKIQCHSRISPDGTIQEEPRLDVAPHPTWDVTRQVLVAPLSGIGTLTGRVLGMRTCSHPPLLVMFWPPPRSSGGGTAVGDVFIAWIPAETAGPAASDFEGYGIIGEPSSIRYGPNISTSRVNEVGLTRHESRHIDQWAVANLLGGPFAYPIAYAVDGSLFPFSRNHFERDAGLREGGYPPPADYGPAPVWPATLVLVLLVLLIFRRRIRWLARVVIGGRMQTRAHTPGRCPVHTTGWSPSARTTPV